MDKKPVIRSVTILIALVVGVLRMPAGNAETASSYDFAASNETVERDRLAGGSASTNGVADAGSGELASSATVSSTRPIGFSQPIGSNFAKRDSLVRVTFTGLQAGSYVVTVKVDVASLATPQSSSPGLIDAVIGLLYPLGHQMPSTSRSYSFVQLSASAQDVDSNPSFPYSDLKTNDGSDRISPFFRLTTGTNTLTLYVGLDSPGSVVVEVHLTSEAWARGDNASASAECVADVTSIRIS